MAPPTYPRWVADVGGTNARFAWQAESGAPLAHEATYATDGFASLADAMRQYLADHELAPSPWCAIGIATPVLGDRVQMTNHPWSFSIQALQAELGLARLLVVNDFTALALSLPALAPTDLVTVGGGQALPGGTLGLLGAGTGLGVSGLVPAGGGHRAIPLNGEGGHVTLAGTDALEDAVIGRLRQRFGHVSAERAVSGPGLVNLYTALCDIHGTPAVLAGPADVAKAALATEASDPHSRQALDLFFALLGGVAGNLALTLGARGGIYIGGGVVPKLGGAIHRSRFRERFEAKGRFGDYLAAIPTWVIDAKSSPALTGALRALDDLA